MLSGSHLLTPPYCQQLRLSFLKLLHLKKNNYAYFKYCIFTFKLVPMYKSAVIFLQLTFIHENKRHSITLMIHGKVNSLPVVQGDVLLQIENYRFKNPWGWNISLERVETTSMKDSLRNSAIWGRVDHANWKTVWKNIKIIVIKSSYILSLCRIYTF